MIIKNLVNMDNKELVNSFAMAIQWEKCDMLLDINADAINKQDSIIASDDATADEIKVAQAKKKQYEKERTELQSTQEECTESHESVISAVLSVSNEYTSNSQNAIRNYLRLSCCDDNSKFFRLAVLTEEDFGRFYDAMTSLHDMNSEEICENGLRKYDRSSENTAKKLSEDIQGLVKGMFSIPLSNDVTKKINVKLNKTDLNNLHETFVKGLNIDVSRRKNGNTVQGREYRYAIERKENKKTGKVEYKGVTFKETLAKLAFYNIFK